jgi:hypothetical protein
MKHRNRSSLDIAFLGDTHELHREVLIPPATILIHTGDFTMFSRSARAIEDFNTWLGELPHRHKILILGNHEVSWQWDPSMQRMITNARLLLNEGITIDGLRVWGAAPTPLYGPPFGYGTERQQRRFCAGIPEDTDVLVTHGPALGILDAAPGDNRHSGHPELLKAVRRIVPCIHVFGHIHAGYGMLESEETIFVNAALLDAHGGIGHPPLLLRMTRK